MLVLKFGGTSVGSPEAIRSLVKIVSDPEHEGRVSVVVVSAFSKVTDALIDAARKAEAGDCSYLDMVEAMAHRHEETADALVSGELLREAKKRIRVTVGELKRVLDGVAALQELSPRSLDQVMSFGERLSAALIADVFVSSGKPAEFLDARTVISTDDHYGSARVRSEQSYNAIRARLNGKRALQVATGFIASGAGGHTTTLGRGGSDLSAAIFGAALQAEEVEIWTDVDGILTADPRLVRNAFRIETISYIEAMELSHFGAKVLHPPTVRPALEKGIPIRIRNTFNPSCPGTLIASSVPASLYPVRGISSMGDVALVRLQGSGMVGVAGFSSRLFGALARAGINIILISQASSEYSICFAVLPRDAAGAASAIEEEFERELAATTIEAPVIEKGLSIIAVVGASMQRTPGISGKVFHSLGRNGVNIVAIAQGSSELNISAVVASQDEAKALNAVHEAFFLSGVRSVNLFLVGVGLIGGTLLQQIARQKEILADEYRIHINVAGIANSRTMLFDEGGLDADTALDALKGGEKADLDAFVARMKAMNLPNTAFCDCTAGDEVPALYADLLRSAIPVITPNKRANAGTYAYFRTLADCSRDRGIPYLYETTVCAGLPVISTIHDLALSGDRIRRIEAVLSGTLSYIFNNFDGTRTFSTLVREAKAKGFTEPDPRDDLNALDAARKVLILARECGMPVEFDAIQIEPIVPAACFQVPDVDGFFDELEHADDAIEARRRAAAAEGRILRYVAVIDNGRASMALRAVDASSPFWSLTDVDNMVVITTDRYSTRPMVIQGPGAGAQVTAGGVFADIVRIARTLV